MNEKPTVELGSGLIGWLNVYRGAEEKIRNLEAVKTQAKERIQAALGDAEVGTVAGRPAVRWTVVASKRFDTAKAKEILGPDGYDRLCRQQISRRFTVVDDESGDSSETGDAA